MSDSSLSVLDTEKRRKFGLNNNALKIIAMLTMLIDHIGVNLLPSVLALRIIGRISFPIFAYMIAEGCRYTRNRIKYFLSIFLLGFSCQLVYYFAMGSMYQNILLSFSLSILAIFSLDTVIAHKRVLYIILGAVGFLLAAFTMIFLPIIFKEQKLVFDYGIYAFILPLVVYYFPNKWWRLGVMAVLLSYRAYEYLAYNNGWIHWFTLVSVALLALYNGERGKLKLKYMFYIFYPLHLVIIYLIGLIF